MNQSGQLRELPQTKFSQEKIAYLTQVQGAINRMASVSTTCKGFSATMFAGTIAIILSISNTNTNTILALIITAIPVAIFMLYDAYYYSLELRYRALYEEIRSDSKPIDFIMEAPKADSHRIRIVLKSKSILPFYLTFYLCYVIIAIIITCR